MQQATANASEHPHIDDVTPLGDADIDCLREIKEVLARHGKVDRFGLHLLHRHFDLSADEVFLEEVSVDNRTLTRRATKRADIKLAPGEGIMTTSVSLIDDPTAELLNQASGADVCRYSMVTGEDGTKHRHLAIGN